MANGQFPLTYDEEAEGASVAHDEIDALIALEELKKEFEGPFSRSYYGMPEEPQGEFPLTPSGNLEWARSLRKGHWKDKKWKPRFQVTEGQDVVDSKLFGRIGFPKATIHLNSPEGSDWKEEQKNMVEGLLKEWLRGK